VTTHPDIFGGKTAMVEPEQVRPASRYMYFRLRNDYRDGTKEQRCATCKHSIQIRFYTKRYRKCNLMGLSRSSASDIRAGGVCDRWEGETNKPITT